MSAPAIAPAPGTIDISGTPRTPFSRLVSVELRKMADTRAGLWLLIATAAITAVVVVAFFFAVDDDERTFMTFMGATSTPQGFLLPVLGILLVTSEWSQRTGLTTFSLEPSRLRVIGAKIVAALLLGLAAFVIAIGAAAAATAVAGAPGAWDDLNASTLPKIALLQASGVLQGVGFGLLFLTSAAAIVCFFALPMALSIVNNIWSFMRDAAPWFDLSFSQPVLYGVDPSTGATITDVSGEQWAQLATGSALWILLPIAVGIWRVLRAEIK